MPEDKAFDKELKNYLTIMASQGVHKAAEGLGDMIGEKLTVSEPDVRMVKLREIPSILGGPETEAVGIYLRAYGSVASQIMLILPYERALPLVDLAMGNPEGTTQTLGSMERSCLAEIGNLTGAYFLNAVDTLTGLGARPSPPAVMVDMVGSILDIIIATCGIVTEHVLMFQAKIARGGRDINLDFWVIPDPSALEAFAKKKAEEHGK